MDIVKVKNYTAPPINVKELNRYAGYGKLDTLSNEISECLIEAEPYLTYKVCYVETEIKVDNDKIDFGFNTVKSSSLANRLKGLQNAIVFVATVGLGIDRLINKYGKISPLKSLIFQSIGAERVESLIEVFVNELSENYIKSNKALTSRFSAGYGDFSLSFQKDIFEVLNVNKNIGVTLNESLIMSPSKSVTAVIGVKNL